MTDVKIDTSGAVDQPGLYRALHWYDLTPFAQGYAEAMLRDADRYSVTGLQVRHVKFSDLAPVTLARIISDTDRELARADGPPNTPQAGAAFWIGRNTKIQGNEYHATGFPTLAPYLADDGLIYFKERDQ